MDNIFDRIFNLIRKEDIVLFVGAGLSLKAGYPSGKHLVEIICNDLSHELSQNELSALRYQPLSLVAEKYIQLRNGSRNSLMQILRQTFTKDPLDLSNQNIIASIPHFKNIISTNYDALFEKAYQHKCNIVITDSNCPYIDDKKTNIFKIHGDLSQPESIIIAQSDYTRYFDTLKSPTMWNFIKSIIATKSVLFLGYGFEDSNIESIFTKFLEAVGNNHKELFLLAPQFDKSKISQLNRYSIDYLDSTAENFLGELLLNIKEHIKDDYENKLVSTDTFNAFCNTHNIAISVSLKQDKNIIDKIEPINSKTLNTQITFTVSKEINNKIINREFQDEITELLNVQGFNLSNMPAIKIEKEHLLDFRHTENDIVFHHKKDISALFFVQIPNKKGKVSLITPKGQLYSDLPFEVYGKKTSILIKANLPLYTYQANLIIEDDNIHFIGTPKFKDHYSNKVHAIYWTNLLYSLCEGGEFTLCFENNKEHKFTLPFTKEGVDLYSKMLDYYEIVSKIEEIIKEPFTQYESYTYDKYIKAKKILCYLTQTAYIHYFNDPKSTFIFKGIEQDASIISSMGKKEKLVMCQSMPIQEPFALNGKSFVIKYENSLLSPCSIIRCLKQPDRAYTIEVVIDEKSIPIFYSDNPIKQEDNKISLI